ncbi:hypothetical protein BU17DRAFT_62016 [Hysterangium stoloniferum]|nr:hypothetical protein BU17DRAFT_62016 [Hysterangium stoloniferum]
MTSLEPSHPPNLRHDRALRGQAPTHSRGKKATLSIPDLRFEQSYLRSLRRFIHFEDVKPQEDKEGKSVRSAEAAGSGPYGVPLVIDWGWVLYVTARDQILSPFAQGAVLAVAALYLRPFLRVLGAGIRTKVVGTWRSAFSPTEPHVQHSSGWTRRPLRDMGAIGIATNIALAK